MAALGQPQHSESGAVIEFAHHYLHKLEEGNYTLPDTSLASGIKATLADYGIETELLIVIDDTPKEADGPYTADTHGDVVEGYIEDLDIDPDNVSFESETGETVEELLDTVPAVESSGALGQHDTWGLHENGDKAKLYGTHSEGTSKDKVTVIDETEEASKWTPYTCQAYDTALALEKLGMTDEVPTIPSGDIAVTLHGNGFWGSHPHKKSQTLQSIISEQNVFPLEDAAHFEFNTEIHDLEEVVRTLESSEVIPG